ncbi:MAG: RCC1 domain-containing protein, partial [Anaerolineales bacterium]
LRADGTVVAWGDNSQGQTLPAPETPTVVIVPTLPPRATLLPGITPQPTQASDVALAPIQNPVPVTPKSNNGPLWGSIVNWFRQLVKTFVPSDDLLWLTRVNVVHASGYYCVGGPMCPSEKVPWGDAIKVLIMPDGVVAPEVLNGKEQDFYPVLCRGKTGQKGCSEFVTGQRPGPKGQWLLDNNYKYPKSLPGVYEFDLPSSWVSGAGTYTFTAYINYNQQAFSEDYSNNFITFQFTIEGDPSLSMAPLARWLPDNVYYFDPSTFVVLQGENCVLGCAQTTNGAVNAGVPVEVYTRALGNPFKLPNPDLIFYAYVSDPTQAAMFACKGSASQNGCAEPFAADTPPYAIPQWFLDSPDASLLNNPYLPLIRFTIPGDKISKSGVYKFTFYVNYLQQASAEKKLSDNVRFFYLQVFP